MVVAITPARAHITGWIPDVSHSTPPTPVVRAFVRIRARLAVRCVMYRARVARITGPKVRAGAGTRLSL